CLASTSRATLFGLCSDCGAVATIGWWLEPPSSWSVQPTNREGGKPLALGHKKEANHAGRTSAEEMHGHVRARVDETRWLVDPHTLTENPDHLLGEVDNPAAEDSEGRPQRQLYAYGYHAPLKASVSCLMRWPDHRSFAATWLARPNFMHAAP